MFLFLLLLGFFLWKPIISKDILMPHRVCWKDRIDTGEWNAVTQFWFHSHSDFQT